ncbi:MAG: hypothetical protein HGB30_01685 [Holophagaceae bacterium]|jgi:hypothetical protein|nr:hypothetical protein [Holophagaceae bacterium]
MLRGIYNTGRIAALVVLGSSFLLAQDKGLGFEFKLRASSSTTTQDNLNASAFGLGFNMRYAFGESALNAELGYFYKPGRQFRAPYDTPATGKTIDPNYSVDSRKNSLNEVNVRLSYEKVLDKSWSAQFGLQIGQAKFRHEYIGDLGDTGWATYEDTYNGTPTKAALSLSPFVGFAYHINQDSAFEFNVVAQSYNAISFHHTPGAAQTNASSSYVSGAYVGDRLEENKRTSLHYEIGYVFRF